MESVLRRVLNLLGRGRVGVVDDTGPVQLVQVALGPNRDGASLQIHDKRPYVQHFGFGSNPPEGSDVVMASLNGDRANGVVLGSNHQPTRRRGLKPGEAVFYDSLGREIWWNSEGGLEIDAKGADVTIKNAATVTVQATTLVRLETPRLEVTGDVIDHCDDQSATLKNLRDAYDAHKHTGVTAGGGLTGLTDHTV